MSNEVERFQSFCRKYVNRKVKEHFKDLGGDDWQPNFTNDRHNSRYACTHQDNDPMSLTLGRLLLYNFEVKGFDAEVLGEMPSINLHESVECVPQIIFKFRETYKDSRINKRITSPVAARHHIRLKEPFRTPAEVLKIATKVRDVFARPVFRFNKGRNKYTYYHKAKQHEFKVLTPTEAEAKRVIDRLLAIDNQEPDWQYLSESTKRNANFNKVEYVEVNGKRYKKPTRRPLGTAHFNYALLYVDGMQTMLPLVDLVGRYKNPVLKLRPGQI